MAERWGKFIIVDHNGSSFDYWKTVICGIIKLIIFTLYQYISPLHTFWSLLLKPLFYITPELYLKIESFAFRWLLYLTTSQQYHNNYLVAETGLNVSPLIDDRAILMVNHQSTADIFTMMYALSHKGDALGYVMWIQDMVLKYTHFGPISLLHGDFYIEQKDLRSVQMNRLVRHLHDVYIPMRRKWIVLFPEGGFLRKRRQRSQEFARKNGFPVLNNVVLPRIGALETVLNTLSPKTLHQNGSNGVSNQSGYPKKPLKWVIDATIGYPDQIDLNVQTIVAGTRKPCTVTVHYRKFPVTDLPSDSEELRKWMYDRYVEKEEMLDTFHRTGQFPEWSEKDQKINKNVLLTPTPLLHSEYKVAILKIFYLVLLYFTLGIFIGPTLQAKLFTLTMVCSLVIVGRLILRYIKL